MMDLTSFKQIWDGTDPGWVVIRHTVDLEHLMVVFEGGADIHDLKALRAVVPHLAAATAADVVALKGTLKFDLGEHESAIARRLKALCASHHFLVTCKARQRVTHGLFNEQRRVYWLIEDSDVCQAVATHAVGQGAPVRNSVV